MEQDFTADDLQKSLDGVDFPADRSELLQAARDNEAEEGVMHFLEQIPDRQYTGPTEVSEELATAEPATTTDMPADTADSAGEFEAEDEM